MSSNINNIKYSNSHQKEPQLASLSLTYLLINKALKVYSQISRIVSKANQSRAVGYIEKMAVLKHF